jgi:O-antigen/teichoic acid export membrane protein
MPDRAGQLRHLTDARTVAVSAVWNMAGRIGPLLVALVCTPFLIEGLGVARWGIFTLALSLVGIFGVFDFGVGRALTRLIADRLATGDAEETATAAITGIALLTVFGLVAAIVMAAGAHLYTTTELNLAPELQSEVLTALYVLCASAPLVLLNAALWGVLSAFQRFGAANRMIAPIQAFYYIGPLLVLPFYRSLVAVMLVLVVCRAAMTYGSWRICVQAMPALRHGRVDFPAVIPLLRFGGWLTVSNLVWPLLLYLDRFVIAARLSAEATAYYATPFDLILRFAVLPIAVMQSAFPAMTTIQRSDPAAAAVLFRRSLLAITALLLPAALAVVACSEPILRLWLGAEFAAHSAPVLRVLGVGVVFMCIDAVPVALLDGIGRPDANAKLAVASLVVYLPLLFAMIASAGIEGAALLWTLRVILTFFLRVGLCLRLFPALVEMRRPLAATTLTALLAVLLPLAATGPIQATVIAAASALGFTIIAWRAALSPGERTGFRAWFTRRLPLRQGR